MQSNNAALTARIRAHTLVGDGTCRLWSGAKNHDGYGIMRVGSTTDGTRRVVRIHRLVYVLHYGEITPGFEVSHTCGHRDCIEPTHLVAMKHAEVIERGNTGIVNKQRATCPQGHIYEGENMRYSPKGRRICRICDRLRKRKKRAEKKSVA